MRKKHAAGAAGGMIFLVLFAGVIYLGIREAGEYFSSNTKQAIVTIGSAATGEKVTLDEFTVNLFTGKAQIKNLLVPNSGIGSAQYSFKVGGVNATLSPWSLFWGPVRIKSIEIVAPAIDLEASATSSNLAIIVLSAGAYAALAGGSKSDEPGLRIDNLAITGARLSGKAYPLSMSISTTLPSIIMKDLGDPEKGMPAADFVNQLLTTVVNQATTTVLHK